MYKISLAPSLYEQIGKPQLTHLNEQDAINTLTLSFEKAGVEFTIEGVTFKNKAGGELATIITTK